MAKKTARGHTAGHGRKQRKSRAVALANESPEGNFALVGFANAYEMAEDGWTLIPYGEWPHSEGIQRFTKASAEKIVGSFKGAWAEFKRAFIGLPVFKGHPDLKGLENQFPDKTEYGQIADMEARDNGLAIKQILSASGAGLVRAGLRFISPHWLANAIGTDAQGVTIYEPVKMKSVGLTAKPNIPNKSLVNTAHTKSPMKDALLKLLGLANEATDDAIVAAVTALHTRPTPEALANEKSATSTAVSRAEVAEGKLKAVETARDNATAALANEKKTRIADMLTAAVGAGIITEAQKPLWNTRLERDFEGESVALVNANPAIKTKPTVEQLRLAALDEKLKKGMQGGKPIANDADGDIGSLVNAEMASAACANIKNPTQRYNTAFANVARKHPELFLGQPPQLAAS